MVDRKSARWDDVTYRRWLDEYDKRSPQVIERLKRSADDTELSIGIIPICDPERDTKSFIEMLNSQIIKKWTCIAPTQDIVQILEISRRFDCICPVPIDIELDPFALAELTLAMQLNSADLVYGDEDKIFNNARVQPMFKPDWDPYLILGQNYVGVPILIRSEALERADASIVPIQSLEGLLYQLTLLASRRDRVNHVPRVLAHRKGPQDWDRVEASSILHAHLAASGESGIEIQPARLNHLFNRVLFPLPSLAPMVSIIVPTKDQPELLVTCMTGILNGTKYPSFEVVIVDNGSTNEKALEFLDAVREDPRVRVLKDDGPFNFSRLNNEAAKYSRGEILLLLNNDTQILHDDWLVEMVSLACRQDVGVVGARLIYPDLRIQHVGVCLDKGPGTIHYMRFASPDDTGCCGELAVLRSTWAVTAACLAIRREVFLGVGGFDEENFGVSFNDVDLCIRVANTGLRILCTPNAELIHLESYSRGADVNAAQLAQDYQDLSRLWSIHKHAYRTDPFFSPLVEHGDNILNFAKPPRPHPFRFGFDETFPMTPY